MTHYQNIFYRITTALPMEPRDLSQSTTSTVEPQQVPRPLTGQLPYKLADFQITD